MATIAQLQKEHFNTDLEPGFAGHINETQYETIRDAIQNNPTMRRWWGFVRGEGTGWVGPEKVQAVALYGDPDFPYYRGNRELVRMAGTNTPPEAKEHFYRTYIWHPRAKTKGSRMGHE